MYCNNCGVELEDNMQHCPLCGTAVADKVSADEMQLHSTTKWPGSSYVHKQMSQPQKKLTWEIVSLILLSGAVATFVVDFIINNRITWSEYPMAVCLSIFCYISLFAFSGQTTLIKTTGGFILSSICMVLLDVLTGGINWSIGLGVPLLLVSNLVIFMLIVVIRRSRAKGINLIAYAFVGAALICISIEGVVSFFKNKFLEFQWSIIVGACIVPVVIVLLFVHFRLKKGRSLEKTFHV
jgi:hypothetical protein